MDDSSNIYQKGVTFFLNKPLKWTSFDVVGSLRGFLKNELGLKKIKVGHAGTLDPLATGLLIICTGANTKRIEEFMGLEKEYLGTFVLGATTPSYDLEHPVNETFPWEHITPGMVSDAASRFLGEIDQVPPVFSAIKVGGKRAYNFARKDKALNLTARKVFIREFEITRVDLPQVDFRIVCSKGTYIRAIARDFGEGLGSGAYLSKLCRTRIGPYSLLEAQELETLKKELRAQKPAEEGE